MMHADLDNDPIWVRILAPIAWALWLVWAWFVLAILWLIDRFDDARQRRRNPYRRRMLSFWAREAIAAVSLLLIACVFLWAAPVILGAMVGAP